MSSSKAQPSKVSAGAAEAEAEAARALRVERRGAVAVVTIERPARRNAMSFAMWRRLGEIFHGFAAESGLRAAILTGAGGHFCAGADISEFGAARQDAAAGTHYERVVDECEAAIASLARPVIAAIEGVCVGGGCGLALACDFRFAAPSARFAITPARLGIIYGLRETHMLHAAVGLSQAKRILMSAEHLDAAEAARIGLIERVVEGPVLEAALAYAARLAENAPRSLAGAKRILNALAYDRPDRRQIDAWMEEANNSEDYREGIAAFREKRPPKFTGR
jgi:enoyl-CoA hydratase/carnithine racemase